MTAGRPSRRLQPPSPPDAGSPPAGEFWLGAALLLLLTVAAPFVPTRPAPVMRVVSVVLLALALVLVGLSIRQLRRWGGVPAGGRFLATTAVVDRGLYALVRHPQYLGCDFLAWGVATSAPHWGTVLPALLCTVVFARQARAEEQFLLERHGDAYRAYLRSVPRFGILTGLLRYLHRSRHTTGGQDPSQ